MEQKRVECPLDIEELGRSTWSFLHTMAAYFPSKPSQQQQSEVHHFITTFSKFYPCPHCADDFRERLKEHPVDASSRRNLSRWMCEEHNVVNRKLGKKEFNCELVDQRWRDGWKDGSCD
ncbi:PREDICTED: FAD-linked sulfhydryl oxidase ALR-like [Priapulus caudatus]|uniref:Sulfhydryl oxidase n=1 Tax=Priapulus caudatus TaxID=37621 RepID=A0ABM1EGQ4_PRICU|nr:PREDICTED: FAD-linked sulfhydryl oxidase ALR-like [Priapulus caudatus]